MPTTHRASSRPDPVLTDRELEVLDAYLATASYKATAAALDLSEGRISDVLENVRSKAGAANTAQAVDRLAPQLRAFRTRRREHGPRSRRGT